MLGGGNRRHIATVAGRNGRPANEIVPEPDFSKLVRIMKEPTPLPTPRDRRDAKVKALIDAIPGRWERDAKKAREQHAREAEALSTASLAAQARARAQA
jgi:hypothetical protein